MVTSEGLAAEVLIPAARVDIVVLHVRPLGVLLEVRHIMRGVAPLQHCVGGRRLLGPLPEKVAAEGLGKLGGEHVPSGRAWRQCGLVMRARGIGHDWLGRRPRDLIDGSHRGEAGQPSSS